MALAKRFLVFVIVLLICACSAFSQARQSPAPQGQAPRGLAPESQVEPITSALHAGEFAGAVELCHSALQAFPNDPHLWALLGLAFANKGDASKALASFRQALKISPNYVMAVQGAAQVEFQTGGPEAVQLLNRLLRLKPGDPTANAMLGVISYRKGDCAGAAAHFDKTGDVLDSQPALLHAYAVCLVRLGQIDKAATVFQRSVALHPEDRQERHLLAAIQVMARKPEDAITTLQPLLESNPDAQTLELASAAYEDANNTPQAVSTLQQAILLDPHNVNLYLDFANVSYDHQSFQVGVNVVTEGIEQQPEAASLYLARGVLYVQLGNYDIAEADFEKAHELDPKQSLSAAAQGMAAVQANDLGRALDTVQRKLALTPNDAILLYLRADILSQQGAAPGSTQFDAAMRSAKKAVSLRPGLAAARGVLAKLYLQSGQYQEAITECRKALEIDPKDQTSLYLLIQALRRTGNKSEIPDLLKRLALLRQQAVKEQRARYQYKLIEEDTPPHPSAQP
jgi:tetratricopeptide (TPR) repeat protein